MKRFSANRYERETQTELPSWIDQLRKYERDTDNCEYWLHMSPLPKIGINPQQDFLSTPIGLYAHPIDTDLVENYVSQVAIGDRMGHDREYGYVLRTKSGPGVVRVKASGVSPDFDSDTVEEHLEAVRQYVGDELFSSVFPDNFSYYDLTFKNLYRCLKRFNRDKSPSEHFKWSQFMIKVLGIRVIEDPHGVVIVSGEPQVLYLDLSYAQQVEVIHNSLSTPARNMEDSLFFRTESTLWAKNLLKNYESKLSTSPSSLDNISKTLEFYNYFSGFGSALLQECLQNQNDGIISPFNNKDNKFVKGWSYSANTQFSATGSDSALLQSKLFRETINSSNPQGIWFGFLSDVGIRSIYGKQASLPLFYQTYEKLCLTLAKSNQVVRHTNTNLGWVCQEMDDAVYAIGASIEDGLMHLLSIYEEISDNLENYYNTFGFLDASIISKRFQEIVHMTPKAQHIQSLRTECRLNIEMTDNLLSQFEKLS